LYKFRKKRVTLRRDAESFRPRDDAATLTCLAR
jgi:hypothetical protein